MGLADQVVRSDGTNVITFGELLLHMPISRLAQIMLNVGQLSY
jgi:hypothetical protein